MKTKTGILFDVHKSLEKKELLQVATKNLLFFLMCYSVFHIVHFICDYLYNDFIRLYIGFFFFSLLVLIILMHLIPLTICIFSKEMREEYMYSINILSSNGSMIGNGIVLLLICLVSFFSSNHETLKENLNAFSIFEKMKISFLTTLLFNTIEYPWHRMEHWMIREGDKQNPHIKHHVDRYSHLNSILSMSSSFTDTYPTCLVLFIFFVFDNLPYFYIYTISIFLMTLIGHARKEGIPFIDLHANHHKYLDCNYGDFYFFTDYFCSTLKF